jgi:hypothetical protein
VQEQAPHLVSLVKQTGVILDKKGINPESYKAAVVSTFDFSGSTEMEPNHLYTDGTMQRVSDLGFAAGLTFDDDGEMPFSLFHNFILECEDVNLGNCDGYVNRVTRGKQMGGTSYVAALQWIIEQAGFGHVNLGGGGGGGFLRKHSGPALSVKATAPYPTYALFVTDGEPQDGDKAAELLKLMSQLPIFVQFMGVGHHHFQYLRQLDDLDGRLIDNAGFFDTKDVGNDQNNMLESMLSEFPSYYAQARKVGLVG